MEIILSVVLSLIVGVLLGAVVLVFKPVEKVAKLPIGESSSVLYRQVYFIEGSAAGGGTWKAKEQAFLNKQTGEITLTEGELNAFIASAAPQPAAAKPAAAPPAKPAAPADKNKAAAPAAPVFAAAELAPGVINFRIQKGVLQAAMAGNFSLVGLDFSPLVQVRGGFAKGADGFEFQPAEFYLGSLPLHKFPGLPSRLLNKLLAAQKGVPEDLKTSWKKLGNIAVEGDTLRLTSP